MEIIQSSLILKDTIASCRTKGMSIGFVPTMGALHNGHLSLVSASRLQCKCTVVSIFVNPTQFNDKNDLKNYPRTFENDAKMLEDAGVDIIFAPSEQEMYPEPDTRVFDFGDIDKVMEGEHRPGHFNGVAQIVSKLFDIVLPDKAFFGEKDFQQLAVIKQLVKQGNYPVDIIPCPIIRENDGLAMSSRNMLLSPEQRKSAVRISKALFESVNNAKVLSVEELKRSVIENINADANLDVEYFEIVDDTYLKPVKSWTEPTVKVGCVAVRVGKIRLIDNIKYNS